MTNQLTDKQLKNWRRVLFNMHGSLAKLFTDEDVHKYRDLLEEAANDTTEKSTQEISGFVRDVIKRSDPDVAAKLIMELGKIEQEE